MSKGMRADNDKPSDYTLLELLSDIRSWNNQDLRNLDEITPSRSMLLARRRVINAVLKKVRHGTR